MASFIVAEDNVYGLLPPTTLRPDNVVINGKNGVNRVVYNSFEARYNAYIKSQLIAAHVPVVVYTDPNDVPVLLSSAQEHMIAAAILRIFDNTLNPYKDLYATGNIFLRAYIDEYLLENKVILNGPEWSIDDTVDLTPYLMPDLL